MTSGSGRTELFRQDSDQPKKMEMPERVAASALAAEIYTMAIHGTALLTADTVPTVFTIGSAALVL
ncbi:hypothetical protein [Mangrovicoccus ximenensis]|uniref:hypothetical protein n=1 Tax=Mangrovicoccus ximenensis TaxID=1911570 RepID=UPI000D33235F|nr:hypothetical protein [Mangrovicoccus ximenensis]